MVRIAESNHTCDIGQPLMFASMSMAAHHGAQPPYSRLTDGYDQIGSAEAVQKRARPKSTGTCRPMKQPFRHERVMAGFNAESTGLLEPGRGFPVWKEVISSPRSAEGLLQRTASVLSQKFTKEFALSASLAYVVRIRRTAWPQDDPRSR